MQDVIWENYHKEFTLIDSLKYSSRRLKNEIELSSLISGFHELLYSLFEPQLCIEKMNYFSEIEEHCIEIIKLEHRKTEYLDKREFSVWHLSMFMIIQTFIEIIESKYTLDQKKEIKHLFNELLKIDFFGFIKLNSET